MSLWRIFTIILLTLSLACCKKAQVLHDGSGKAFSSSAFNGHFVVVNYWASWCENCRSEIHSFNQFYQQHKKDEVLVYGVEFTGLPPTALQQTAKHLHIQYPLIREDIAARMHWGPVAYLPTTFILNRQGKVAQKIVGPMSLQKLNLALIKLQKQDHARLASPQKSKQS